MKLSRLAMLSRLSTRPIGALGGCGWIHASQRRHMSRFTGIHGSSALHPRSRRVSWMRGLDAWRLSTSRNAPTSAWAWSARRSLRAKRGSARHVPQQAGSRNAQASLQHASTHLADSRSHGCLRIDRLL